MKNTFIIILGIFLMQCTGSKVSDTSWNEINYSYQTGTMPPPYYHTFTIKIINNGEGKINYSPDYDDKNAWGYNFRISENELKELTNEIVSSNIMEKEIESKPDNMRPIGGDVHYGSILFERDGKSNKFDLPGFPESEEKAKVLEKLYTKIKSFVSKDIWDDIEIRKKNYIEQYKDK